MRPKTPVTLLGSLFAFIAADPLSAQSAAPSPSEAVIELSPFVVNSTKDTGYQAMSTLAGTRLDTPLKDIGASISIYTKDFLEDINATSSSDFLLYATSMEAAGPGGNWSAGVRGNDINNSGGVFMDAGREDPQGTSRSRGLTSPTFTRDFFTTRIPGDTYNTERVTVLRGPNAALFGVSSPSGVTDTSLLRADLGRNSNRLVFRYDNNGGTRSSVDFNRVLVPNTLAVRLAGLQMREEYNQRPSYEQKERLYGTITYSPFKSTTLRGNFETGRHRALRPILIPASDSIPNDWYVNGRPGFDWAFYDDPARNPQAAAQNSGNFLPYYMANAGFQPITTFYNNPSDQTSSYSIAAVPATTAANVGDAVKNQIFHPLLNRDLAADALRYSQTRNIFEMPVASYWIGGNVLPGQLSGLAPAGLKPQNYTNFDVFDWAGRMIDESAVYTDNFHASNFVFEQRAWDNRVGIELAYNNERLDRRSKVAYMSGGQTNSHVRIDTTVTLPNGLPNPNLGRPFALSISGASQQLFFNEVETRRATAYLKYDFKDMNDSWGKWLGRHTLSGLLERYGNNIITYQTVFKNDGPLAIQQNPVVGTRTVAFAVYFGPSIIGNNNPLKLDPIRVAHPPLGPAGTVSSFFRAADATDPGAWRDTPLSYTYTNANGRLTREVIESRALTLQSYWLQDHVTTVFGWRHDADFFATRSPSFVTNVTNPNDPGKVLWGFDDLTFPSKPPPSVSGDVKSYSVVLRWPQRLLRLPKGTDFSVFYNKSENFTAVGGRTNRWGIPLPPPKGTTQEYGFNVSAFNDKLTLRANWFENASKGLNGGGSAASLIGNLPLDTIITWSREGNTNPHLVAMRNADIAVLKSVLPVPNYLELYNLTVTGVTPNITASRNGSLPGSADTTDFVAKGEELDIIYNPTPNWRILANVAHQRTVANNIGPNAKIMLALLLPAIKQLANVPAGNYPLGWQPGTPLPATTETFGAFVDRTVLSPYAVDRATEGNPSTEQRNWRANLVTSYTFGRGSIFGERLKGWQIGGGVRWQGTMVLGFPSSRLADTTPIIDREHAYYAPSETNVDAFVGYGRKIWDNRIDWKLRLNATNIYTPRPLIPLQVQPWGQVVAMRIAPEQRWFLTNTFSF